MMNSVRSNYKFLLSTSIFGEAPKDSASTTERAATIVLQPLDFVNFYKPRDTSCSMGMSIEKVKVR